MGHKKGSYGKKELIKTSGVIKKIINLRANLPCDILKLKTNNLSINFDLFGRQIVCPVSIKPGGGLGLIQKI